MLCLLFSIQHKIHNTENTWIIEFLKNTKRKELVLKGITISLLKVFKRFFIDGFCGLP